eukprot:c13950_g1_i1.p1 GENE.c13950_g1_i1~~c13950_g1_i1.p1  ORF type:complete len:217 (+),score=21.58 c13950_g1_i1:3-653(+)
MMLRSLSPNAPFRSASPTRNVELTLERFKESDQGSDWQVLDQEIGRLIYCVEGALFASSPRSPRRLESEEPTLYRRVSTPIFPSSPVFKFPTKASKREIELLRSRIMRSKRNQKRKTPNIANLPVALNTSQSLPNIVVVASTPLSPPAQPPVQPPILGESNSTSRKQIDASNSIIRFFMSHFCSLFLQTKMICSRQPPPALSPSELPGRRKPSNFR